MTLPAEGPTNVSAGNPGDADDAAATDETAKTDISTGDDKPTAEIDKGSKATATGESDDQDTAADESESKEEDKGESEGAAPGDEEEGAEGGDAEADLDDETIEAISEVYRDRLLASKGIKGEIDRTVKSEVTRQVAEQVKQRDTVSETDALIQQGQQAVTAMSALLTQAQGELGKAAKGEEFVSDFFDPNQFGTHLRDYGAAILSGVARTYDAAIEGSFNSILTDELPDLSDSQAEELKGITDTHERMAGDRRQAPDAEKFLVSGLMKFIVSRAREHGITQERERLGKSKKVGERIAKQNVVKAAKAEIEKGKVPPKPTGSQPRNASPANLDEAFEKAVESEDHDRQDAIIAQMMSGVSRT